MIVSRAAPPANRSETADSSGVTTEPPGGGSGSTNLHFSLPDIALCILSMRREVSVVCAVGR